MNREIKIAVVGNPNCGKTTFFNAITGSQLKVANWPGVTVEKIEGIRIHENTKLTLIDTPGIYSLSCYTIEEKVTRKCIMDDDIDVIINVVDASSLERNLFLTLQLLELGKPVVVALNMMDIVRDRGLEIDMHRLPEVLGGIPVIPVSAAKRQGLDILLHAAIHHYEEITNCNLVDYGTIIEDKIKVLEVELQKNNSKSTSKRWHAIKLLEQDKEVLLEYPNLGNFKQIENYEKEITRKKYHFIESIVEEVLFHHNKKAEKTDHIDQFFTHPILGVPIFLSIMALVFFLTFFVGDTLKGVFVEFLNFFSEAVANFLIHIAVSDWMISLVVDGIIAGVGGILTFIPNILILFIALAILEDSGYMARVAYVMDHIMGKVGLSGKAFLPMILGFGCSVPAIMATRALENEKDRRKTMIITPFMSCSAKLPIYVLLSGMFFQEYAVLVSLSMYVIGLLIAILTASMMNKLVRHSDDDALLIELPEYKKPNFRTICIYVSNKIKDYLLKAGTTIFIASIIIWFLLHFGVHGMVYDHKDSFGAMLGMLLVPILKPAGLGIWQLAVALISGISAKEVVVSSMAVLFGVANPNSTQGMANIVMKIQEMDPSFGPLNAYCFMLFSLLYIPCIATIATIKKESNSMKFTIKVVSFQLGLAWLVTVIVFQAGKLLFGF